MTEEMKRKLDEAAELITGNPLPVEEIMHEVGIPITKKSKERFCYQLGTKYLAYDEDDGRIGILRRRKNACNA